MNAAVKKALELLWSFLNRDGDGAKRVSGLLIALCALMLIPLFIVQAVLLGGAEALTPSYELDDNTRALGERLEGVLWASHVSEEDSHMVMWLFLQYHESLDEEKINAFGNALITDENTDTLLQKVKTSWMVEISTDEEQLAREIAKQKEKTNETEKKHE